MPSSSRHSAISRANSSNADVARPASNAIVDFIDDLNRTWQAGRYDDLRAFYHPDVVLLPPDAGEAIRGRESVVASYVDFGAAAELESFEATNLTVFDFETTSSVHMRFVMRYRHDGRRFEDQGLELYTLQTGGPRPQIVWRCQWLLQSRSERAGG